MKTLSKRSRPLRFVVQEHHARALHWDFRLEMGGVLKSWAVPKGPSRDASARRLAVEVEDHSLGYIDFTGRIAEGSYGAGLVYQWDTGEFVPEGDDPLASLAQGALSFELRGKRLRGGWRLYRMKGREQNGKPAWLLQKVDDAEAVAGDEAEIVGPQPERRARRPLRSSPAPKAPRSSRVAPRDVDVVPLERFLARRAPKGDLVVDVAGTAVHLTSLDRLYWPDLGITKFDLLRYYAKASAQLLPFLEGRPAILQRFPRGVGAPKFFQHDLPNAPDFVRTARMRNEEGREIDYVVYTGLASLLYLVNLGTVEQHPWHSRLETVDTPDWLALDLDPHGAPWENVLEVALAIRELLAERDLAGFPKTSGSAGLHVYVPLESGYSYERVLRVAEDLAREIAGRLPKIATVERSLAKRAKQQIYVDYLQNARGKSMAAPLSVRGKPGATVSMPLTWRQVERGVRIDDFDVRNALAKYERSRTPWENFFDTRQLLA